jgi:hypothetical protein
MKDGAKFKKLRAIFTRSPPPLSRRGMNGLPAALVALVFQDSIVSV